MHPAAPVAHRRAFARTPHPRLRPAARREVRIPPRVPVPQRARHLLTLYGVFGRDLPHRCRGRCVTIKHVMARLDPAICRRMIGRFRGARDGETIQLFTLYRVLNRDRLRWRCRLTVLGVLRGVRSHAPHLRQGHGRVRRGYTRQHRFGVAGRRRVRLFTLRGVLPRCARDRGQGRDIQQSAASESGAPGQETARELHPAKWQARLVAQQGMGGARGGKRERIGAESVHGRFL